MTYQVIARKWRPQTFKDLVGQAHVTETLGNAIRNSRVAHAYIFSGARGVGKTTAARILAKALNCVNGPTAKPCGVCVSCQEIAAGTSLDVIEIDAASNRGIDQIRELREMVRYAPAASRSKVVILDEAHMLTNDAANALLKTLEEPPDQVIFVMATTEPDKLPDTIRSRSQHFHFRALTFAEITGRLQEIADKEKLEIEPAALAVMARMAEGSLRDALSLLEQARAYCGETIRGEAARELFGVVPEDALEELVGAISTASADRALTLVQRFQKEGRNLQHFCGEAIRHIRNILIAKVCGADSELIAATPDQRPALARAAEFFSEEDLTRFFQILLQTEDDLRRRPDPRVHLEMGLLRLINASRLAPLEELLAEVREGTGTSGTPRVAAGVQRGSATRSEATSGVANAAAAGAGAAARPFVTTPSIAAVSSPIAPGDASQRSARAQSFKQSDTLTAPRFMAEPGKPPSGESNEKPNGARNADVETTQPSGESATERTVSSVATGLSDEQVAEIKTVIRTQQKFLGELVEHSSRWELEGSELRLYFPVERRAFAEMLEGRDSLEKVRAASSTVLGRPVRVCVKLESSAGASATASSGSSTQELRAKFEGDPMVKSMLQRFGGKITEVKRRAGET
jgi:DNA polymerase III subunit gamma/tau